MGWVVDVTTRPLYPRERPRTDRIGGGVGSMAGPDGWGKSRPPPGSDHRTAQLAASHYTDWAIPSHDIVLNRTQLAVCLINICRWAVICFIGHFCPRLLLRNLRSDPNFACSFLPSSYWPCYKSLDRNNFFLSLYLIAPGLYTNTIFSFLCTW
jgi:hypothetical protein